MSAHRRSLFRLGLAWLAMMQVMMFALPGYLRTEAGPNDSLEVLDWAISLMNWASLALTAPVVSYAAWPVWQGVARAVSERRMTMDIPVAMSMTAAFIPSVYATLSGRGEVYFDSVTMFVAFLLTARFFEARAHQTVNMTRIEVPPVTLRNALMTESNRIAGIFILIQLGFSFAVAVFWWLTQPEYALSIFIALLVMSCPCALALAAPMSLAAMRACLTAYPDMSSAQRSMLLMRTRRITKQNLYGALIGHVLTMPLAAVGWVTPWLAALFMFVSSVVVALNAWRLYAVPYASFRASQSKPLSPETQR